MSLILKLKVIQRRGYFGEPRETFYRNWTDYKQGFGKLDREFWLGNDKIYQLTKSGDMMLRVELEAHDGRKAWAEYDTFRWVLLMLYLVRKIWMRETLMSLSHLNNIYLIYIELRVRTRDIVCTSEDTQELLVTV